MDAKGTFAAQRAALKQTLEEAGLAKEWVKVEPFVRDSISIGVLEKGNTARVGASRLGGNPDLPPESDWPSSGELALTFLGQLDLDEVHPWDIHGYLPESGLLSIFVGHGVDKKGVYGPVPRIHHFPKTAALKPRKAPKGVETSAPVGVQLTGQSVLWPFGGKGPKAKDPFASLYMRLYDVGGPTRHHALFGTDRAREGIVDPKKDEVLLRLDRADDVPYDFQESSTLYLVAARSDLVARRFDRVRAVDAATV